MTEQTSEAPDDDDTRVVNEFCGLVDAVVIVTALRDRAGEHPSDRRVPLHVRHHPVLAVLELCSPRGVYFACTCFNEKRKVNVQRNR